MTTEEVGRTFRGLVESAERKFGRVRDVAAYGRGREQSRQLQKVFKAYTRVWKYQQDNRSLLVSAGLKRWEIGEIASRIGQLYYGQYLRTSQSRFLVEAYVFYEAILDRSYFEGGTDRLKELRFMARFVVVAMVLNRYDMVDVVLGRFKGLLAKAKAKANREEDCNFNFKEWTQVVNEVVGFVKEAAEMRTTLRCHHHNNPSKLRLREALVSTYHRKEVKLGDMTLDAFRMMQCLEWEFQSAQSGGNNRENGHSGPSALIDINCAADSTLPPNPRKAILYRPCVTHLIALLATICEELPPHSLMLVYLSASSGKAERHLKLPPPSHPHHPDSCENNNNNNAGDDAYLWFGPAAGSNKLYPGDIIPFTRRPLFLIVDSDISHAFKVLHGAESGEPAALLLSPSKPTFKHASDAENGSQFTFFLTAPMAALFQLLALSYSHTQADDAQHILSTAFSDWESILLTSPTLHLAWAQALSDPFLRRLILRFIFCRSLLFFFCPPQHRNQCLPTCLPSLPTSVSPDSQVVRAAILRLVKHLRVQDSFHFDSS